MYNIIQQVSNVQEKVQSHINMYLKGDITKDDLRVLLNLSLTTEQTEEVLRRVEE